MPVVQWEMAKLAMVEKERMAPGKHQRTEPKTKLSLLI